MVREKPHKPYPDFPLTANGNGQWSKKILGKVHYFGVWEDWQAALNKYLEERDYLYAGQAPPSEGTTLATVLNAFDDDKKALLDAGRIAERTYKEYVAVCDVIATLGKTRPVESVTPQVLRELSHKLSIGKRGRPVSPVTHKRLLTFARMVFKFANDIRGCNIAYSQAMKPPEKKLIRERRAEIGERMFSADQIRTILAQADPHLKAMIYLGINCGFGPKDCITLPTNRIQGGYHEFARRKTGVTRRCPLWPETQEAIAAIAKGELVLNGRVWTRHVIARQFKKLCESCGIYKAGVTTPYSLRRTFETVAKNANVNQSVIDKIMGHERPDMSEVYNQKVFDSQLRQCVNYVRDWLLGSVTLA